MQLGQPIVLMDTFWRKGDIVAGVGLFISWCLAQPFKDWVMSSVRALRETHNVSATEPNRLMLFGETVAVYCENLTEHTDTVRTP
jgi:hypothetical protein